MEIYFPNIWKDTISGGTAMLIYSGGIYASLLQKKFWKAMTGFIPRGIAVCIETGMKSMYGIKIFQPVDIRMPSSCCFDEWGGHCGGGLSHIMTANGLEIYDEPDMADLNFAKGYFKVNRWQDCYDRNLYFLYRNGKLTVYSREMEKEILYCHFQKREIYIDGEIEKENFLFVSPGLVTSDMGKVRRYRVRESIFVLAYYFRKIRRKLKNER